MNKISELEILPSNFRDEIEFLKNNDLNTWEKICNLNEIQTSQLLQQKSLCTESRLKKIKAIAIFIVKLKLTPHQAYLLLHAGIGSLKTLSTLNPYSLKQKIGRLERKMGTRTQSNINQTLLKDWIKRSKDFN
tara:strand:- start:639 stop:1037 length:399 start_codon:yes stop_codon:yes gene_type:complete